MKWGGSYGPHRCSKTCFWCVLRTQHRFLGRWRFSEKIFSKKFFNTGFFVNEKNYRNWEKPQGNSISLWFFQSWFFAFVENENVLKIIPGPHNGRKTFQAIRAGVLVRFPGVSPRFLQFFLQLSFKNRHFGSFSTFSNVPKMGVSATLGTQGSRNS